MQILLATSNPHKLDEIIAIWRDSPLQGDGYKNAPAVELVDLSSVDPDQAITEPVEDQLTFEGNARLKARYYAVASGMITLADDSGLEVDALGGQPGVRSARFAGATGSRAEVDQANNERLIKELEDVFVDQRTARFVCAMALCVPSSVGQPVRIVATVRGIVEGRIIGPDEPPRGQHGFGYDPLFFMPELGVTTAQLSPSQKNAISHRGRAARLMRQRITRLGPDPTKW